MQEQIEETTGSESPPSYKVKVFYEEDQAAFFDFYHAAESLMFNYVLCHTWTDDGMSSEAMANLVEHVKKFAPTGPFKHQVTDSYVRSVMKIVSEVETLIEHRKMDEKSIPRPIDQHTRDLMDKIRKLCDATNELLKQYYYKYERTAKH